MGGQPFNRLALARHRRPGRPGRLPGGGEKQDGHRPRAFVGPRATIAWTGGHDHSCRLPAVVCEDGWVRRLLVVRHAQSVWNAANRWQGWSDAPLSELGVDQAHHAGRVLAGAGVHPDLVACSDLSRARRTAEILASELGYVGALTVDADLREQDLGDWNGLTRDEIISRWPADFEARRQGRLDTVPGGEPGARFQARAVGAIRRVAAMGAAETVVVAHGGVVIALEKEMGTWSPGSHHGNLSGWWLEVGGPAGAPELVPEARVDLLAERGTEEPPVGAETVPGTA